MGTKSLFLNGSEFSDQVTFYPSKKNSKKIMENVKFSLQLHIYSYQNYVSYVTN